MSSLVEDLLLLARLDAGRPLESDTVDLTEMVVNAVSDAHAAAPDHQWQLDLPDEPVEVRGDGPRLHQIVANLLANARTHTDPGTMVRTSLAVAGDRVLISVHDNGPGVPESLQADVVRPVRPWRHLAQPRRGQHRPRSVDRLRGRPGPRRHGDPGEPAG